MSNVMIWQPESGDLLPVNASSPREISSFAVQLGMKDRRQISSAFEAGHYEMAVSHLWSKTVTALKKELSAVGVGLLGEMLGLPDVDANDDVEDILTARDAIRLAEELGIVSSTDAMRLRHTHELVTHFSQLDSDENDSEEIDEAEAMASLKACVKSVLGRPKVEVAKKFVDFRDALETESLQPSDQRVEMLQASPYFFHKLTVSVLVNAAKKNSGANLEHALANINAVVPVIWPGLKEVERWQIGRAYAEVYADGRTSAVGGLKSALLKVRGFDYVPENLRSDTFVKAADAVIKAHEGVNNFYNEGAPVRSMSKLGSTIPTPAIPACLSALLCVVLGNRYGVAWDAQTEAKKLLSSISADRWQYYFNHVFSTDVRILSKLALAKPIENWCQLVCDYSLGDLSLKNTRVSKMVRLARTRKVEGVRKEADKLVSEYYGKHG